MGESHFENANVTAAHYETVIEIPLDVNELINLIAQAEQADEESPGGATCREIAKATGMSRGRTGERLRSLIDAGLLVATAGKTKSPITGQKYRTWIYKPTEKAKELLAIAKA